MIPEGAVTMFILNEPSRRNRPVTERRLLMEGIIGGAELGSPVRHSRSLQSGSHYTIIMSRNEMVPVTSRVPMTM